MAGTQRRLIDTALLLAIGGAFVYVSARQYQTVVIVFGLFLATEPWAQRAASTPYAFVVTWSLFVLLTASPRGSAAAQAKTDFYTLPSQPNVVLISTTTDKLVGVYLKSKNKLGTKIFFLKPEGGQNVTLVQKHLGRLHR